MSHAPIKLELLEPRFVRLAGDKLPHAETLAEAQGVWFGCPECFAKNGNSMIGTHMVLCWFRGRGVPDGETPGPGRWQVSGSGLGDLTLAPSVHLTGAGCGWHGFVRNGLVTSA